MTDLIRAAEMGVVPLDVFKATVKRRLLAALAALEHVKTVPSDVLELADEPFMGPLNALDEFLYAIGRDARRAEDVETERERKVAAKVRHPEIERVVTRIDERVQEAVEMLGTLEATPSVRWMLAPMYADPPVLRGELNPCAKLTAEKAAEIRRLVSQGEKKSSVARRFSVSHSLVRQIMLGTAWRS
jgi:hypothetical protein